MPAGLKRLPTGVLGTLQMPAGTPPIMMAACELPPTGPNWGVQVASPLESVSTEYGSAPGPVWQYIDGLVGEGPEVPSELISRIETPATPLEPLNDCRE